MEGARERREFHLPSAGVTFAVDKGKLPQQHVMGKEMDFWIFFAGWLATIATVLWMAMLFTQVRRTSLLASPLRFDVATLVDSRFSTAIKASKYSCFRTIRFFPANLFQLAIIATSLRVNERR